MPTIQESLDALDNMVTNHAATPEIRSQIAYITREVTALETDLMATHLSHSQLQEEHAKLQQSQTARDNEMALENKHKVRVTLTNGITRYYDANTYEVLPYPTQPKLVEVRNFDKAKHSYWVVATISWQEIAEIHKPKPLA